ncbi:MAG TPA: gamma-glutamyltransferase [Longimicrobiales bacterium]|nr:gamma-glutamyltransferase [Longimicrobiales bacterium]
MTGIDASLLFTARCGAASFHSRSIRSLSIALMLGAAAACTRLPQAATPAGSDVRITDPAQKLARSPHGMVASASPLATAAGARVLAQGGNAVDAAVATGFALAVVEPVMSGLGGRTSIVLRTRDGEIFAVDGLNQVPRGYRANSGIPDAYERAAIPGQPAALLLVLERYGTMSRQQVMAPAIRYAEEGFALTVDQAQFIAGAVEDLRGHPASARYFLKPDGAAYRAGEHFIQRDLARTLRSVAEHGAAGFYSGWVADSIHADMTRHGGFITRDELAAYEALPAIVVRGGYRGHEIVSAFRPASGHSVIQALQMLETLAVPRDGGPEWAALVGQAMHFAMQDRGRSYGTETESARVLTSREHASERASQIVVPGPAAPLRAPIRVPSRVPVGVAAGYDFEEEPGALPWARPDRDNTTHLSTADRFGGVVALTQSLGPGLGTRLAASGTGVIFATRLGAAPGSRPGSTIAPTLVLRDGRVRYVLGGAGDNRIITAVTQSISRAIDQGLPLEQAVAAPRVHPLGATQLRLEDGAWSPAAHARLQTLGFELSTGPGTYFGRVHAVATDPATGSFTGIAEPRGFGGAAAPVR